MVPTSAKTPYKKINKQIRKYIKKLVFGGFYAGNNKSLCGEIKGFRAFHSPRNQVVQQWARGFESHPVRQKIQAPIRVSVFFAWVGFERER